MTTPREVASPVRSLKPRILVTWGTKLGGTEGIARIIGATLEQRGFEVTMAPAARAPEPGGFDAAIVGGALYGNRWHADARRFVRRNVAGLRRIPVWLFSSGPLDDSADREALAPTKQVSVLMERIGALGHVTFGGRLAADARGFPAATMARTSSGDWRNPERIRTWAASVGDAMATARPGVATEPPARSLRRLAGHALAASGLSALLAAGLLWMVSVGLAVGLHAAIVPFIYLAVAAHYFGARGARDALPTAVSFTGTALLLDVLLVAAFYPQRYETFVAHVGTWLGFVLIFVTTSITGFVVSTMPWPVGEAKNGRKPAAPRGLGPTSPRGA